VLGARIGKSKSVVAVRIDRCVECLACLKQCPADAIFNRSGKKCKADVKSIPNLHYLVNRGVSHLRSEDRWLNMPTVLHNGIPMVVEDRSDQTVKVN
jgi:Fe-S-cluster-containing hydrogenase component 2